MIKAVLLDFDGTLVKKDILDVVCGIAGKEEHSRQINRDFHQGKLTGLTPLINRINFLQGVTLDLLHQKLNEEAFLMDGVKKLFEYFHQHKLITILSSGNLVPILQYYQQLLGIDYVVGTQPQMDGNTIKCITESDFPGRDFKLSGIKTILDKLGISFDETVAFGDSPADKIIFDRAKYAIAVNPKGGIETETDFVIHDNLAEAIPIMEKLV